MNTSLFIIDTYHNTGKWKECSRALCVVDDRFFSGRYVINCRIFMGMNLGGSNTIKLIRKDEKENSI